MNAAVPYPLPNLDLIWRVTGHRDDQLFESQGQQSVEDIERALASIGKQFSDFARALDFGCGCGRILRWLDHVTETTELHGVDIDSDAIAWVNENLPFVQAHVGPHLPPLDFPEDHFDLIFNHSVFTHLDENYQDAWLEELRRIATPDGVVLLTVAGEHPFEGFESTWREAHAEVSGYRREFEDRGIVYITDDGWVGGPFPDFYHSTFHGPWYVFKHWRCWFEIRAYLVRASLEFTDFVVLRPRAQVTSPLSARTEERRSVFPRLLDLVRRRVSAVRRTCSSVLGGAAELRQT
jgi:SAM-dependent methyltransferase